MVLIYKLVRLWKLNFRKVKILVFQILSLSNVRSYEAHNFDNVDGESAKPDLFHMGGVSHIPVMRGCNKYVLQNSVIISPCISV